MTKTVTLTEPEPEPEPEPALAGRWDVGALDVGRLVLSPHIGPTIDELEGKYGERLQGDAFEGRWGDLSRDGEG